MTATPKPNWNLVIKNDPYNMKHVDTKMTVEWNILAEFMTTAWCGALPLDMKMALKSHGTLKQKEILKLLEPTALQTAMEP